MPAPTSSRFTPGWTRSCSRALLDEARTFNLRVAGHLGLTDAVTAARRGLGSLEHLSGIPEAALADPSPLYPAHRRSFFGGMDGVRAGLGRAGLGLALAGRRQCWLHAA